MLLVAPAAEAVGGPLNTPLVLLPFPPLPLLAPPTAKEPSEGRRAWPRRAAGVTASSPSRLFAAWARARSRSTESSIVSGEWAEGLNGDVDPARGRPPPERCDVLFTFVRSVGLVRVAAPPPAREVRCEAYEGGAALTREAIETPAPVRRRRRGCTSPTLVGVPTRDASADGGVLPKGRVASGPSSAFFCLPRVLLAVGTWGRLLRCVWANSSSSSSSFNLPPPSSPCPSSSASSGPESGSVAGTSGFVAATSRTDPPPPTTTFPAASEKCC